MQINSNKITVLCGSENGFDGMADIKPLAPFSDIACRALGEIGSAILKSREAKSFPDVITFGFFCRKANIDSMKNSYSDKLTGRIGRGVTFHIAPSNVPINFAYSLAAALLSGNASIVRASAKPFRQVDLVCECINEVLSREEFSPLKSYVNVVRYSRDKEINDYFSALCDVRIIWGGDNTIAEIRTSPLPPRSTEITFADRYSIAVIGARRYLDDSDKKKTARDFYNDTYLYDQNACSSPRLIYWLGSADEVSQAKKIFWENLHELLKSSYAVEPVIAVDKFTAACRMSIDHGAQSAKSADNLISRIEVDALFRDIYDYRCPGGSFIEYSDTTLDALADIVTRKYQTLSYTGIDKEDIYRFVSEKALCGIDRIVPIGKTADFSLTWDGYDLVLQMSRVVFCA